MVHSPHSYLSNMLYRGWAWGRFWKRAQTLYRVHSPLAFSWAQAVLEDRRPFYVFEDIEALRRQVRFSPLAVDIEDFGAAEGIHPVYRRVSLRHLATRVASTPLQGRWLFRTVQWLRPRHMLELGSSIGIGTAYLAAASSAPARFISLEGCPTCAQIAHTHLDMIGLSAKVHILSGPFHQTLSEALRALRAVDLAFFDGHHRAAPTLSYFEQCLPFATEKAVFVFDDIHHSAEMDSAWKTVQNHPRVRLTIDCFELGFAFFDTAVRQKQHFYLVPASWKPWQRWL